MIRPRRRHSLGSVGLPALTPAAAVSCSSPSDERSHEAHTCPPTGSAALRSQQLVHRAVKPLLATLTHTRTALRNAFAALTMVSLLIGGTAAAASAGDNTSAALRTQVDTIGARYLAAQEQARSLDSELQILDQELSSARRRTAELLPQARARAVALYQSGTSGFSALFDTTSAMESARRAELLSRASEHTQALLDQYANSAADLRVARSQVATARVKQQRVVAELAKQAVVLEQALAKSQQAYRDQLAAEARAAAATKRQATTTTNAPQAPQAPTTSPAPPSQPVPVNPPAPPAGVNPHHNDPFLVCTRTRESSGVYTAVNPAGYYGAYQFSAPTWDLTASHGGRPQLIGVRPDQASAWDQDQLAWVLYQWRGNAPWGGLC